MDNLIYYTPEMIMSFEYYQVPKWMMSLNINGDSKLLYALLLDRYKVSLKNGWVDGNNRVYIIFTRDEAIKTLNIGNQKCSKLFMELINKGLLEEKRQGQTKPNLIYLKSINYNYFLKCENHTSRNVKITSHEMLKSHVSKNNYSKSNISNNIKYNNKIKIEKENKETNKINKNIVVENESNLFDIERFINSELVKTDIARYYEANGNAEITDNAISLLTKICNSYGVRKRKIINSFTDKAYQDLLHDSIYLVDPDINDRSIRDKSAYLNSRIQYQIDRHLESNT